MEESVRRKDRLAAVGRVGPGWLTRSAIRSVAMRGAIQVLQSNTPPESMQADLMDIILRESDRLNSIITNFLSYAKPKVARSPRPTYRKPCAIRLRCFGTAPSVRETHILKSFCLKGRFLSRLT